MNRERTMRELHSIRARMRRERYREELEERTKATP